MSNDYNSIFGAAASSLGFDQTEEEKKKKKQQSSQVAAQKQTQSSYDRIFGEAAKKIPSVQQPTITPTATPTVTPPPEQKQSGLFDKVGKFVTGLVDKVKPKKTEIAGLTEEQIAKTGELIKNNPQYQEKLDQYMKFPSVFPNPDFTSDQVSEPSAMLTPSAQASGQAATEKFLKNPIDTTLNIMQDALYYHPEIAKPLAFVQNITENTPYIGLKKNPFFLGVAKGVNQMYLGSSDITKDTLNTRLTQPTTAFGKGVESVGQLTGSVLAFIAGGEVVKGLQLGKLGLPILFATLGQTSASSSTTTLQRLEKLPVDIVAGWLFSFVKPVQLAGKSLFTKEALAEIMKVVPKSLGVTSVATGPTAFINALIEGRKPKEAAEIAATSMMIGSLFYLAGSAIGLFSEELLSSKTKSGSGVFTPEEIKSVVENSQLKGTKLGDTLNQAATEAQKTNKNVQVDIDALNKTVLAKKLDLNKPEGLSVNATLVDKNAQLPSGVTAETEVKPVVVPEIISKELGKEKIPPTEKAVVQPEVGLKQQEPDLSLSINKTDYEKILKPKIDALPEVKSGEVAIIQTGSGEWVDTQVDEALGRGVNKDTQVKIVKESDLTLTGNPEKDLRGERKLVVPTENLPKEEPSITPSAEKPITDKFFVHNSGIGFVETKGKSVPVGANLDAFVHKSTDGTEWVVTEAKTGMMIGSGKTQTEALVKTREIVASHEGEIDKIIAKNIKEQGLSPRYEKSATIKGNEPGTTNQNLGGGNRPRQPANPLPEGEGEQAGVGTPTQKPVGEVARGVSQGGDISAGKRPGTRIETAREAAKDLIKTYVLRGDTLESIQSGHMGVSGGEYNASIGGYFAGKPIPSSKIVVDKLNGKEINETFSLKELYDEIKVEGKTKPTAVKIEEIISGDQYRTTPEGQKNLLQIVKVGDIVHSNYSPTKYRVEKITPNNTSYIASEGTSVPAPINYSLSLSEVDAERKANGKLPSDYNYSFINELVAVDGKLLKVDKNNNDEVFIDSQEEAPPEEGSIETKVPFTVMEEAKADWLENYIETYSGEHNQKIKNQLETAFINKWRQKAVEYNKPSKPSPAQQVEINEKIELLVMEKGSEVYTEEEKALLRQYTGSGGLEKAGAEGRGLLDEYYTPKPIVDFVWDKIKNSMEITEDMDILEPSAGIGSFLEEATKFKAGVTAQEINQTASRIAKALYPSVEVFKTPFESNFIGLRGEKIAPEEIFDLVVGNPPYGEHRGKYLGLGEEPKIVKYEDYFMKRGLDLLKPNGLLAYVIPSAFLRSGGFYAKEAIASLGYLEDAYRLPNGAFGTTSIGTDIVFIRKQPLPKDETNMSLYRNALAKRGLDFNDDGWFKANPDKVLGTISKGTGNYGADEVKGTLENAIKKAQDTPVSIEDSIPNDQLNEIEKAEEGEIVQAAEAVKSDATPPANRVAQSPVMNNLNKKAQIIPAKKDSTMKLNNASEDDIKLWQSVDVTGALTVPYIANFEPTTFTSDQVAVVMDGNKPVYYPNVSYYQGNIYEKLDDLELFRSQINPQQYEIQKKGLEAVLPTPQPIEAIQLQPVSDFVKKLEVRIEGQSVAIMTLFRDFMHSLPWEAYGSSSSWEVEGYISGTIVNTGDKLQNIEVRKRRRQTGNSLFKRFVAEVLTPEQQQYMADRFNRTFNAYSRPDYRQVPILSTVNSTFNPKHKSGSHPLVVKEIQKEGAAFLATKGTGLLAYDVGVGKTMTAIIAINDVLKRGWAKRPLIVVPNGVYRNWINEISEIIPGVKINSLVNLGAAFKGDLKTLSIDEGTISIITYDGLVKLGFKPETYDKLTGDLKDVMAGMNNTKRGEAKEEAKIEQEIGRAIRGTTADRFFEDLGFDHITIDEVHNFKNIFAGAKLQKGQGNEFRNVRGSSSARGIKAYLMSQYVLKNNNDRNVFLLSATPFTNSPMEIYSILSLMGKRRLENLGLKNVNDFMSMFMELKPTFVVKADQSVKEEDIIEKFQNLQQLQKIVTEFIDFRTGEEAGIDRPGRIKRTVTLSPTDLQNQYISRAQELFSKKNEGGAIVAITELQNITLSPYLSRYNETSPSYIEFVENSPKIKFALEGVAQVHKDNKEVGQIIYMPRGVDKFDLIRQYLIKEKGFKPGEIGEITGGMSIDAKQKVQEDFNAGTVKVLLGTEAIKEGVNLQERATDMYHLHLPWNPTDMLQVEGRIWRQGNDWANVRVHYPLIENSVDSFIFQKLETKEKRIRNLWSYKDNEISLGDLNFEDMKLDLITNPVIRVAAEQTFETKKETQKLEQLKVEKSFINRKIDKLAKASEEVTKYETWIKEAEPEAIKDPESYEASNILRWKRNLSDAKGEVTAQRNDLIQKGIDVVDLEKKSGDLQTQITTQEATVEALDKKFEGLIKEAEGKVEVSLSKPNNYSLLIKTIADENATFFKKRSGQEAVRTASATQKAPGGNASLGGYADIESATKSVEGIRAVEFPELLRLTKELTGNTPTLKRFRRALGRFYEKDKGYIKLSPEIFKDPKLAAKVFAHEMGHLADYLPDKTLMRGNLLGRINTLNKFLRGTFGEKEVTNAELRIELKELSQLWKPFDELENPGYTSYRYSSSEIYADAISVLFNDPALLQEKAPKFWREFFDALDSKPEVKEQFVSTWDLLNQGDEGVFQARQEAINNAYEKGEDIWKAKALEKQKTRTNVLHLLQVLFDDRNAPLNRKVAEAIKSGRVVEDAINPKFEFAGLNYLDGKIKNFIGDNYQPAYVKAAKVDGGWVTLGEVLQLERSINERGELANPGGYDPLTAKTQLDALEKHTSPEDWAKIQEAKSLFRDAVQATVKLAEDNGYYTPEMIEEMKANPAYATFQVLDYLDTYVSSRIHKQVGTLKDVANPATSTVMKAVATARAIEYNNAKKNAVDFQREMFKEEIEPAKTIHNGRFMEIRDPSDPDQGLVIIIRNGKPEGYYLPKDLADVFNHQSDKTIQRAAKISRLLTGSSLYRPLFTTVNLGFQTFNFVRDFMRYWKNMPDSNLAEAVTSFPRAVVRYGQAIPHAYRRVVNKPDELIKLMENSKILGMTFNDAFVNEGDSEERQIERILQKVGVLEKTRKRGLLSPIYATLQAVEVFGNFIETLPKVAGYIELKSKGTMKPNEMANFIRTKIGSPDFRTMGEFTPISNNILMFSNAYKEGIKSDFQVATEKKTRSGFWWKTIIATFIPKLLMVAATLGLAGTWMKKRMDDVSEYDKTNYTILPIGVDENGKTVYMRIPQDETGRFLGGILWKLSHFVTKEKTDIADFFNVIDFGAGQLPNLVPSWNGAGALLTYLSGQNPYDSYRGRNIIPDTAFKAGPKESFPIFLDWLLKNQGLGIIVPSYTPTGEVTTLEKILNAPVISNIAGRWIKVSNYGQTEQLREITNDVQAQQAQKLLEKNRKVDAAVKEYTAGTQNMIRRIDIEKKLIKDVLGDKASVTDQNALIKKFKVAVLKGKADANTEALLYAVSNAEKVALLEGMKKTMNFDEFKAYVNLMHDQKIIGDDVIIQLKKTQ